MSKVPGNDLIDPPRNQFEFMYNKVLKAQATADRRLELLKRFEWYDWDEKHNDWFCVFCDANKRDGHTDDCRLAEELDDTALEDRDG